MVCGYRELYESDLIMLRDGEDRASQPLIIGRKSEEIKKKIN